jgi:hypothetical protein
MGNLRIWLDHRNIEPADFVPIRLADGQLSFDVYFRQKEQAVQFQAAFGVPEIERSAAFALAA